MDNKSKVIIYCCIIGLSSLSLSSCGLLIQPHSSPQKITKTTNEPDWYSIESGGQKPNRYIVYAYYGSGIPKTTWLDPHILWSPAQRADSVRNDVVKIFENANSPDRIAYTLDFICSKRMIRVANQITSWRNNYEEETNDLTWRPVAPGWQEQAMLVSCSPTLPVSDQIRPEYINMLPTSYFVANYTWQKYWIDGNRPEYTTTKSKEEVTREYNETMANLGRTINDGLQKTSSSAQQQLQHIKQQEDMAIRKQRRSASTFNRKLEGWIGQSETTLLQTYGAPAMVEDQGNSKYIIYVWGSKETIFQGNMPIGENDTSCTISFLIVNGKIYDFESNGDGYCLKFL